MTYLSAGPGGAGGETTFRELWDALRRRRWLIAASTLASLAIAVIVLMLSTPRYQSEATLRIMSEEPAGGLLGSLPSITEVALPGLGDNEIDTELGVLRSRRMAEAVVDSLDLHVALVEPRLLRDSAFRVLTAPREARRGLYTYERTAGGAYRLIDFEGEPGIQRTQEAAPGEPLQLGQVTIALTPDAPERLRIAVTPFYEAVDRLRDELLVEKQEGGSQLVELRYRAPHPELARSVVDGVVQNYLAYTSATSHQELRRRVETLNEQTAAYRADLALAEERLRDFRAANQIVDPQEQATQQVRLLAEVTADREQAVIERQSLVRLLDEVRSETGEGGVSPYRKLLAFPSFITNQGVQAMLESLSTLEDARSELLILRTPENSDVRQLDQRIGEIEEQLYRLSTDYVRSLDNRIAAANASLTRFGAQIESLPDTELAYARLFRETELLNEVYVTLQTRLKEAEVQYAVAPDQARLIDAPLATDEPVSPRPAVTLVLALLLGGFVGIALAVAREALDTTIRTPTEVELAAGGLPVVGMIPRVRAGSGGLGRLRAGWQRHLPPAVGRLSSGEPANRLTSGPLEPVTGEAFRALRASIMQAPSGEIPRLLVLTSPRAGDGKTLSAANLAVTLARQGERVLIVDANFRGAELFRLLGGAVAPGLAEVLLEKVELRDAIQQVDLENPNGTSLSFLAAGGQPRDPSGLISSDRLPRLLDQLRGDFDRVIVDAPALDQVADGALLAALSDAALLVVRAGGTDRHVLEQTVSRLRRLRVPIGGVILTDVSPGSAEFHALPSPFGSFSER